jgi:hypothetical protein
LFESYGWVRKADMFSALTFKELSLLIRVIRIFLRNCFQFLVLRKKVEKLKNSKKGEKTLFVTM